MCNLKIVFFLITVIIIHTGVALGVPQVALASLFLFIPVSKDPGVLIFWFVLIYFLVSNGFTAAFQSTLGTLQETMYTDKMRTRQTLMAVPRNIIAFSLSGLVLPAALFSRTPDTITQCCIQPLASCLENSAPCACYSTTTTLCRYCLKVYFQGCTNCNVTFSGKILTGTLETFKCENLTLQVNTKCGTIQGDICDGLDVTFGKKEDFIMMVWAGCEKVKLGFADADDSLVTGFTEMDKERANVNKERSQFKLSIVGGKLVQEPVVRLANGFTTTAREKKVFDDNQEFAIQQMAKTMGITIKPGKKGIKVKVNDPCPCGSGKKVKKCCPADAQGYWKPMDERDAEPIEAPKAENDSKE